MDEDELIGALQARAGEARIQHPAATRNQITAFEQSVELRLPAFYARVLSEVANGGFGPGLRLYGIPPSGYVDEDLRCDSIAESYRQGRGWAPGERQPLGLIALCNWGCGVWSYVDALSTDGTIVTWELLQDGDAFVETATSLAGWLAEWVNGLEVGPHEIVGYRDGINPFTRAPMKYPMQALRGRRLDLSARR
jgi:hypothetical protein